MNKTELEARRESRDPETHWAQQLDPAPLGRQAECRAPVRSSLRCRTRNYYAEREEAIGCRPLLPPAAGAGVCPFSRPPPILRNFPGWERCCPGHLLRFLPAPLISSPRIWARIAGGGCFLAPPQATSAAGSLGAALPSELLCASASLGAAEQRLWQPPARKFATSLLSPESWLPRLLMQTPGRPRRQQRSESIQGREAGNLVLPSPIFEPVASGRRPDDGGKVSRCPATSRIAAAGGASSHHRCSPRSRWIASARVPATCSWRSRERARGGGGAGAGLTPTPSRCEAHAGPPRPPSPPTNDAARSAPMQICRGLGIH